MGRTDAVAEISRAARQINAQKAVNLYLCVYFKSTLKIGLPLALASNRREIPGRVSLDVAMGRDEPQTGEKLLAFFQQILEFIDDFCLWRRERRFYFRHFTKVATSVGFIVSAFFADHQRSHISDLSHFSRDVNTIDSYRVSSRDACKIDSYRASQTRFVQDRLISRRHKQSISIE
jgi:hypothetical protein